MGEERLGVGDVDAVAEVAADGFGVVEDPALSFGVFLIIPELALVGFDGFDLFRPLGSDVQDETGDRMDAEVGGVIVNDLLGVMRFIGHICFGEFGGKPCVLNQLGGRGVVGVGVGLVGGEEPTGLDPANALGDDSAVCKPIVKRAIGQIETNTIGNA